MTARAPITAIAAVLAVLMGVSITLVSAVGHLLIMAAILASMALVLPSLSGSSRTFWWMHPGWGAFFGVIPGIILVSVFTEPFFIEEFGSPKLVSGKHIVLALGVVATFSVSAHFVLRTTRLGPVNFRLSELPAATIERLGRVARILFWLTVVGYGAWTVIGVARGLRPSDVASLLEGAGTSNEIKDAFLGPVAGITTLTQFGPIAAVALMLTGYANVQFRHRRYVAALFLLVIIRAVVYSERLALVELAIPVLLLTIVFSARRARHRRWLTVLPLWAPIALLLFFGTFEYLRSWSNYYRDRGSDQNYAAFTAKRLGGYYATALNNGAGWLEYSDGRDVDIPYHTLHFFWNAPGVSSVLPYSDVRGTAPRYDEFLRGQANPEFNNATGVLLTMADIGVPLAFAFWALAGAALGWAYARFKQMDLRGLLLYPILITGALEAGRVLYWTLGSAVPSIAGAIVIGTVLTSGAKRSPVTARSMARDEERPVERANDIVGLQRTSSG